MMFLSRKIRSYWCIGILIQILGLYCGVVWAGDGDFSAAAETAEEIAIWLHKLKNPPKSLGIFSVNLPPTAPAGVSATLEAELVNNINRENRIRIVVCTECRTPQVRVNGDRILITKGAPNLSTFVEFGKKLETENFVILDVFKTRLSMITQATVYDSGSGSIVTTESFKVPDLDFTESATQFNFSFGPGIVLVGRGYGYESSPPLSFDFSILEEVTFGKAGINLGTLVNSIDNSYFYFLPTIGFKTRLGRSSLHSLTTLGLGYGVGSPGSGPAMAVSYNVYLGSFAFLGVKANGLYLLQTSSRGDPVVSVGMQVGFAIGR